MISLEESLAVYARELKPLPAQSVAAAAALHRVLSAPLRSATDLPRFDQSAMDGYALRAADIAAASAAAPRRLPVRGQSAAGHFAPPPVLAPGTAMRIFTGARLPEGADTVIPQERVKLVGAELDFSTPYPAGKNIRYQGEELHAGEPVAAAGQRITPGLLASLVNAGLSEVQVHRQPRMAVFITGDEVRPSADKLRPGEIPDSNGPLIQALLTRWGYPPPRIEYLGDLASETRQALARAFGDSDLVITTGGASVGDKDFIPAVAPSLGVETIFWKVAQKPGKPLFFGRCGKALLLGLPGNPASVLVGIVVHARRILDCLEGVASSAPQFRFARLAAPVASDAQRTQLLRMRLEIDNTGQCRLHPLARQDSHMLSNLNQATALAVVPTSDSPCASGTVLRWVDLCA